MKLSFTKDKIKYLSEIDFSEMKKMPITKILESENKITVEFLETEFKLFQVIVNEYIVGYGLDDNYVPNELGTKLYEIYDEILTQEKEWDDGTKSV